MKSKGFTLVELMIVLAVLGILAALIIPSLFQWNGGGQRVSAQQQAELWVDELYPNAKTVHISCQGVDSDHDGYVSCTVRVDKELIPIECSSVMLELISSGCRVPKPRSFYGR